MKYEIDLHLFSRKLSSLLIHRGMIDSDGNPDKIALYNALYPNDQISQDLCNKDHQFVTDKTRKIDNWIKGKNYPGRISDILYLCNVLNCDLDYFFTNMEAPTYDIKFISEEIGLSINSIERLINYDKGTKHLLDSLINNNERKKNLDVLYNLLLNMLRYAMGAYETKVTLTDSLIDEENEIHDAETIKEMLKLPAINAFNICLDHAIIAMHEDKKRIHDIKSKAKDLKIELLEKEIEEHTKTFRKNNDRKE